MKVALGMYTTLSSSTPAPAFKRALSLVYQPVLRFLYNSEGIKFNLYQSSGVMKYFENNNPEVNMLLSSLCKRGDLEILSGSYSQSIIGLNLPKDRGRQIERMTTYIRKTYGSKAKTAFFYGQIWSPQFISTLSNCALSSVAISSYKATSKTILFKECSIMNELGKRVKIIPILDEFASLVSKYAQREITYSELKDGGEKIIKGLDQDQDVFIFINLDQLLQGMALSYAEDDEASDLIPYLIGLIKSVGGELVNVSEIEAKGPCYLDSGWYGRDASTLGLNSFNEIFVKDGTNRYLLNRLFYVLDVLSSFKKDRDIKRISEDSIACAGSGPLFLFDPQCGPLRTGEREEFWKRLLSVEKMLYSSNEIMQAEAELEDLGEGNTIVRSRNFTIVYSPFGGSVIELDLMDHLINVVDAKSQFEKSSEIRYIKHSFSDIISLGEKSFKTYKYKFSGEAVNKSKSDYIYSLKDDDLPFDLEKVYKVRTQTFSLESTLTLKEDAENSSYAITCYLMVPDQLSPSEDENRALLLGSLDNIKTMRAFSELSSVRLVFTSTSSFSVKQELKAQSQFTVLGKESFNLYNKLTFSFPFSGKKGESFTFKIILRSSENKDKE